MNTDITLYYLFSTEAQSLAGIFGVLAAFSVLRLQRYEDLFEKGKIDFLALLESKYKEFWHYELKDKFEDCIESRSWKDLLSALKDPDDIQIRAFFSNEMYQNYAEKKVKTLIGYDGMHKRL